MLGRRDCNQGIRSGLAGKSRQLGNAVLSHHDIDQITASKRAVSSTSVRCAIRRSRL